MIRKRPEKDTVKPPGQVKFTGQFGADTLARNIEQWKQYERSRSLCPVCRGNNKDMPCAYPEGGQPGCLKG